MKINVTSRYDHGQEISVVVNGICNHFDKELEYDGDETYEVCNKCKCYREIKNAGEDAAYVGEWQGVKEMPV